MSQYTIPCVVYRGGTSRGLFFHKKDLPVSSSEQARIFIAGIGSPDVTQINGLGGGNSHSSKVAIIAPSVREGIDVDYTFIQVALGKEGIDQKGTCGNLLAAVGAFAVDEGLVEAREPGVQVLVYNTNIAKVIKIWVPVVGDKAQVQGDYHMPGVSQSGAKYIVDIVQPGGGKTGQTFPLGLESTLSYQGKRISVTFADIVNPFVFTKAQTLGLEGIGTNQELSAESTTLEHLAYIRNLITVEAGLADTLEEAAQNSPAIPKIAFVAPPREYIAHSGQLVKQEEVDIVARMVSMGKVHHTFAVSGLLNLAATMLIRGTIPNQCAGLLPVNKRNMVRIGHPGGIAEVRVTLSDDFSKIEAVGLERTARKIMQGQLYIPRK